MKHPRRDKAIVKAFLSGERVIDIAARYDLTDRRIKQIIAEQKAHRSPEQAKAARGRLGRPRLDIAPERRREYAKLRDIIGVAAARQAMGIAA